MSVSAARPRQKHKHIWIAVALQCVPLLAAAGCANVGLINRPAGDWVLWSLWSVLFWGLGYAYLGRIRRWVVAGLIGPLFTVLALVGLIFLGGVDFEHDQSSAEQAGFEEALLIASGVLVLSIDAWRLAVLHNAALDAAGPQLQETPA